MEGATTQMQTGKGFDQATYDATKTYLKAALEQMIAAGHSAEELAEFATDKFGGSFFPYLREFQQDIRAGRISVQGLKETSRASIFSARTNPEERERMVRETAYLRAEQRGFVGGSQEEDWLAAEAEVDEMLARKAGLFERGDKALDSARTTAQKEFGSIQTVVYRWIEGREGAGKASSAAPAKQIPTSAAKKPSVSTNKPAPARKAEAAVTPAKPQKPAAAPKPGSRGPAKSAVEAKRDPAPKESGIMKNTRPATKPATSSGEETSAESRSDEVQTQTAKPASKASADKESTTRKTGTTAGRRRPASKTPRR